MAVKGQIELKTLLFNNAEPYSFQTFKIQDPALMFQILKADICYFNKK